MKASDIRDTNERFPIFVEAIAILHFPKQRKSLKTVEFHLRNMSLWRRAVPSLALLLCIACQTIESSALWNTSMLHLQDTLEGMEVTTQGAMAVQVRRPLCSESRCT